MDTYTLNTESSEEQKEEKVKLKYPQNLLYELFGEDMGLKMTEDRIAGLNSALEGLEERSRYIISLRFEKNMTLLAIGQEFNVTRERVRQILCKSIEYLRDKPQLVKIIFGLEGAELRDANAKAAPCPFCDDTPKLIKLNNLERYRIICPCGCSNPRGAMESIEDVLHDWNHRKGCYKEILSYDTDIKVLGLSPRVYNSLMKNGYNTMGKVISLINSNKTWWEEIPKFGTGSALEVEVKLRDCKID